MSSTQLSWEWLAGFFDGEGCISVCRNNYKPGQDAQTIRLQIHQKQIEILDEITEFIFAETGAVPYLGGKKCHSLQYTRQNDVIAILDKLIPYLRVKKEFAIEAHAYMSEIVRLYNEFGQKWRKHAESPVVPTRARLRAVGGEM